MRNRIPDRESNIKILLDITSNLVNNYHNTMLEQYGITTKQSKVLAYLYHHQEEDIQQKDIEEMFFLRSSTVTSVMQNLEKEGFIERYISKNDKRMKRIVITQKGYQVYKAVGESLQQLQEIITNNWSEKEKEVMIRLLEEMIEQFKDKKGEQDE